MKTNEIAVTDLRPGFVIVENKGTKHEKTTTVRRLDPCTQRRGFVHVNAANTDRGSKGGHALCYDLISSVHVKLTDETADIPTFAPTIVLGED